MPDPTKNPKYAEDRIKVIEALEKVLNMLKNDECLLFGAENADLIMKQGKGKIGKKTGIKRISVDYKVI